MTQEEIIRICENLPDGKQQDPLHQMMLMMMNMLMEMEANKITGSEKVEKYADKYPRAVECLEEGFEDSIQYYGFPKIDSGKISSTNTLERLNKEVRRRSRAVGIFPGTESYLRLMTASLIEYSEDHLTGASYISADALREQKIEWEKGQEVA